MATPQPTSDSSFTQPPINTLGDETPVVDEQITADESQISEGEESTSQPDARESAAQEEARRFGWVPKDEWQSDPARWRSATDFLAVREQVNAFRGEENSKLRAEVAALKAREQARATAEQEARERITADTLRSEMRIARENSDWDKVDEITEKLVEHKVAKVATAPKAPTIDPAIVDSANRFKAANAWVEKDPMLGRNFALELKNIVDLKLTDNFDDALSLAKERVARMYPEKFRRPNGQTRPIADTGGTSGNAVSSGKTWADLKPHYRQAAEKDIAAKRYTRQEYLDICNAEDPAEYFRS